LGAGVAQGRRRRRKKKKRKEKKRRKRKEKNKKYIYEKMLEKFQKFQELIWDLRRVLEVRK